MLPENWWQFYLSVLRSTGFEGSPKSFKKKLKKNWGPNKMDDILLAPLKYGLVI